MKVFVTVSVRVENTGDLKIYAATEADAAQVQDISEIDAAAKFLGILIARRLEYYRI